MGRTVASLALRVTNRPVGIVALSLLLSLGVLGEAAIAQVVSAVAGTDTTVETVGDRINISGGQLSSNQDNLFHSFEQFDVTATQTANFETIPGVQNVFGRIDSAAPSVINGSIQISGSSANLYLINPAGILMGPNAGLNLSGGFTATTATGIGFEDGQLSVATYDYSNLAGTPETFHFDTDETGSIVNLGDLQVDSGSFINLIGGTVINSGSLRAPEGAITLAAVEGNQWVRLNQNNQLLSLEVQENDALLNSIETASSELAPSEVASSQISALLTGSQLSHASALFTDSDGNIRLGSTEVTEEGGHTYVQGSISVAGETGGSINVLGDRIALIDASIDASGDSGGGRIRVGGDYQGSGPLHTAEQTLVDSQSTLTANAGEQGNGGNIVVWSDDSTEFYGHVSAQGGSAGGDGGFVEVSGKRSLVMSGSADLSALQGDFGTLLLDPDNVEITDGAFEDIDATQLSSSYVENLFNTTNLEITALGDIHIHDVEGDALTIAPNRSVVFRADAERDNNGAFKADESISIVTEGGTVSIFGAGIEAGRIDTSSDTGNNGGDVTLTSTQGIAVGTISTSSRVNRNNAGTAGKIVLDASGGDIVASGDIEAQSEAGKNNADLGGGIQLEASGNITVQNILARSATGMNNAMSGGSVSLLAGNDIITRDINTQSVAGFQNAMSGGSVDATSSGGSIMTGAIATTSGSVTLSAPEDISVRFIDARGNNNHPEQTTVDIETAQTFRVTETIPGTLSSISTLGTTDGDTIIQYNNAPNTPFVVGDASFNGTDGYITSPSGAIENGSYLGGAQEGGLYSEEYTRSNHTLVHTNVLFPEPEVPTEPETPIEPEVPTEPEIPTEPEVPTEPEIPTEPEVPTEPEIPGEPETPAEPDPTAEKTVVDLRSLQVSREAAELASTMGFTSSERTITTANGDEEKPESESQITVGNLSTASSNSEVGITFEQTEQAINAEFRDYLGISSDASSVNPASLRDVQQTLESVEQATDQVPALVYFYFVPTTSDSGDTQNQPEDESRTGDRSDDELEIMVITGSSSPIWQRQAGVTRAQVEQMGIELRQSVTSIVSTKRDYLLPAQQLYSWLLSPVEASLEADNIDSIGFVLDTGIRTIPWASLHDGEQFLIENYSVGLLPSFALTDFSEETYEEANLSTANVLAMGASQFKEQPHLPAVSAELDLIANHLGQGDTFLNERFVLSNLQTQLQNKDYDILHLATHATFESGRLDESYIQFWDDRLALNEMGSLQLSEADIELMILSACNTAMGDAASEYGFAGFAVSSGSQSALASLWPVSDEGTLGFMTQFYEQLSQETTRAESLRQAQLSMMRGEVGISDGRVYGPDYEVLTTIPELTESGRWDFSHPFYWSAFTMIGNPW